MPRARPTLTVARMVKASGSSTRSSLFSVPSTRQDTASSSAKSFFRVLMVVMTVCRRTPRVAQGTVTHHPPDSPGMPQEGGKRAEEEEEWQRCDGSVRYKVVYCNKPDFLTKEDCLSLL